VKPAPRPAARQLLAGRFLVARASLLALPDGPVTGLDVATGDLVALAFGPGGDLGDLAERVERWNGRRPAGCPAVRGLHRHLGRTLTAYDLLPCAPLAARTAAERSLMVERAAALGEALSGAGLGLAAGPADLALGHDGPLLRRPAIWPLDPERPLSKMLAEQATRSLDRIPERDAVPAVRQPGRMRRTLARAVPCSRRARVALVVALGVLSAVIVSALSGPTHAAPSALARAPQPAAAAAAPLAAAHPRLAVGRSRRPQPSSRGGPARELLAAPLPTPPPRTAVHAPLRTPPVRVAAPTRGWVDGLFVGS
jgi:hypothetical protein